MRILAILVAMGALLVLPVAARADLNLIANGSFESGNNPPPPPSFRTIYANTPQAGDITGWTVTANSIDWIGNYWQASDGQRSLDMSGYDKGTIVSQTFATTPGAEYLVSFYMAGNPDRGPAVKTLEVSAAGGSQTFTFDTTGHSLSQMGWERKNWVFTALADTTTLSFSSLTTNMPPEQYNAWGPALDDVYVGAVPVPGAVVLGLMGLGTLGWWMRRYA
jgi:choice-of-anchor C domain-containing protein